MEWDCYIQAQIHKLTRLPHSTWRCLSGLHRARILFHGLWLVASLVASYDTYLSVPQTVYGLELNC